MQKKLLALYGLKFNPFSPEVPTEALYVHHKLENFCWRIEHAFFREGGFSLISGEPGTGKSVALRVLDAKLKPIRDVQVGILTHTTAHLTDFYREMSDIFGVMLSPNNRWRGFKDLRSIWRQYLEQTLIRPVLIIDEAQEMPIVVLNELRLLTSSDFDSRTLLSVVLAGDKRLNDKLKHDDLIPLGSRIRVRYNTEYASQEQLLHGLKHLLESAGNPQLMTSELMQMLCEHAMGNYRVLTTMSGELLALATQKEIAQLDINLFFDCFSLPTASKSKNRS